MNNVDYMKLAEQYANFLVAVGGVSITALTLVLSLRRESKDTITPTAEVARAFLVAALSVSTACCFIGAQMMAETSAFISHSQGNGFEHPGLRLFLLATTNIFMAAVLVLFALMLLPTVSGEKQAANLAVISFSVFALIVLGALFWMVRAAIDRMPAPGGWPVVVVPMIVGICAALLLFFIKSKKSLKYLVTVTFVPIISSAVISLFWFAIIFGEDGQAQNPEIIFFSLAVTFSYTALIIAGIKIMRDNKAEALERRSIGNDVVDKPEHEQKKNKEERVSGGSKRRYMVAALLFAAIFIASTILIVVYESRMTAEVNRLPLYFDGVLLVSIFQAIVSAIGTFMLIRLGLRSDEREERKDKPKIDELPRDKMDKSPRELPPSSEKPDPSIPEDKGHSK